MRPSKLIGAVASALLVPSISSAEFVYTNIQASFVDVELSSGFASLNGDGYRFEGSIDLNEKFFLQGELEEQSFDFGIDGSTLEVGVGYHHSFSSTFDFVGTASFVQADVDVRGFGADDDGIQLGGGVRTRMTDAFEVEASLQYRNMDEGGSDTGIELLGRYYFTDRYAFFLETDLDDNVDTLSFGFRAEF